MVKYQKAQSKHEIAQILEHSQFVFDRYAGGELVTIEAIPKEYSINITNSVHTNLNKYKAEIQTNTYKYNIIAKSNIYKFNIEENDFIMNNFQRIEGTCVPDIVIKRAGYTRCIGGEYSFALLLSIIKLRWWPDFSFSDDYGYSEKIEKAIEKLLIKEIISDETNNWSFCSKLFFEKLLTGLS